MGMLSDVAEVVVAGYELFFTLIPTHRQLTELRKHFTEDPPGRIMRPCVYSCCWGDAHVVEDESVPRYHVDLETMGDLSWVFYLVVSLLFFWTVPTIVIVVKRYNRGGRGGR